MRYQKLSLVVVVVAVAGFALRFPVAPTAAQTPAAPDWTTPRLPDGQPDLQGVWLSNTAAPVQRPPDLADRPRFTDEEVAALRARAQRIFENGRSAFTTPEGAFRAVLDDVDTYGSASSTSTSLGMVDLEFINRTSLVVEPSDGRIPAITPEGRARTAAVDTGWQFKTGPEDLNSFHRCITTGVPRLGGNFGAGPYSYYQLVQTSDHVVFVSEAFHDARIIPLDSRPHLPETVRQWNGDSRGHWEGDTLVVETRNFSRSSYFHGAAEGLHLVERFTRSGPDTLAYEMRFTDPATWAAPWSAEFPLKRRDQPIYEFACHEGNHSMEGMLRTARLEQRGQQGSPSKALVRLHSMTTPRDNRALASLCGVLNELDVCYPDTELRLVLEATQAATE